MNITARIKQLSLKNLWRFFVLFLRHPIMGYQAIKATKQSIKICNDKFGMKHHGQGQANAFRHAFWNYLICKKCVKYAKNDQKSVDFAKKLTDLYEKATQNEPMDQAMDYHNNAVGRSIFIEIGIKKDDFAIVFVEKMSKNAKKVSNLIDFESNKRDLV